jgi:predicted membrane protein
MDFDQDPREVPGRDRPTESRVPHDHQALFSTRLVVGIVIVCIGLILLADNLGWFDARYILRSLWPLALVCVGVAMVRSPDHRRSRSWGWVLITVGIWLFLERLDLFHVSLWHLLVPGLLLFVGGTLVWRAIHGPPKAQAISGADDHVEFVRSFALMSACELRPVSRPFRGADLTAVMGGIKLDLADARMEADSANVEVFAFWGGIEIHVPPDWTVTSKVTTLLGGFVDKRRPTSVVPTKTLIVRGMVVMGGIEVKN